MRKIASFSLFLLFANIIFAQVTYTHTITSKTWSSFGTQTLSGVSWTASGTPTTGGFFGYEADRGQQFGSKNDPHSKVTLSTSGFNAYTITSIKVSTAGGSSTNGKLSVSVGGTTFSPNSINLTTTNTEYTFTGSASGEVVLSWTQTSSRALYLKKIEVTYTTAALPTVTVNPTSLSGFSYTVGNGPSSEQPFTVSGTNLTDDVILTPDENYEISTSQYSGFTSSLTLTPSSGTLSSTTIYVRLVSDLPAGTYNNKEIVLTSTGATTKKVTCSGIVIGPTIQVTPTSLTGLDYLFGTGPSSPAKTFTVSGSNLTDNIRITAPSAYEISTNSSSGFTNIIDLSQSGGNVAVTTIYVRLKANLVVGTYAQSVSFTSTGAVTKNLSLLGEVYTGPCLDEGFNAGTTAPAGWTFSGITGTYTSSGNYGAASPSVRFDGTGDMITTPTISSATELSFWIKGQGTNAGSALLVEGFTGGGWVTIDNINSLPTTGTIMQYTLSSSPALPANCAQFRFTYTKDIGNLAFDDVHVICTPIPNTITTVSVNTPPFNVTCSNDATGTVTFTSTDAFSLNTYTAQLSDASGSFAFPKNIGSLKSDANSGTINITIPPGTPSGSSYKIRVISSNPPVMGTVSAPFAITLNGGPCSCYEIECILVDACDPVGNEGANEMFRFSVGANSINTSDIVITWPSNPWLGVCQNAQTDSIVATINATITPPGQILQPVGGVIPAGATVMFFTSTDFEYEYFDFSALNYTLYAVFQCAGNTAGHFRNYYAGSGNKYRTLTFTTGGTCGVESVTYRTDSIYNGNGAIVYFDVDGNATYSKDGQCSSVPILDPLPIELLYFKSLCNENKISFYWATAAEINNDYFTIEAIFKNGEIMPIAKVFGVGNSNNLIEYNATADNYGADHFRLKQTDFDGKTSYSDIIFRNCVEEDNTIVFPTFINEGEFFNISGEINSAVVFDATGRVVNVEVIDNKIYDLKAGFYYLVLNNKTFKLIVN